MKKKKKKRKHIVLPKTLYILGYYCRGAFLRCNVLVRVPVTVSVWRAENDFTETPKCETIEASLWTFIAIECVMSRARIT